LDLGKVFGPGSSKESKKPQPWRAAYEDFIMNGFFSGLLFSGLASERKAKPTKNLDNITRVIIIEANVRKQPLNIIYLAGFQTRFFSTVIDGKNIYFERLPTSQAWQDYPVNFDDKYVLKKMLNKKNIPSPKGGSFFSISKALDYARSSLDFPLVVKPQSGSLSKHTTCGILNETELILAIKIAKIVSTKFVVEEHIPGDVYRVTLVDGEIVAACLRLPASVVGDGRLTIKNLIIKKNNQVIKRSRLLKNPHPQTIPTNEALRRQLKSQGLKLSSVLETNKKVILHPKLLQICGSEAIDYTDNINTTNTQLLKDTARLCKARVVGIDLIAKDIARPFSAQPFAVIEVNSLPNIDMHHFPTSGKPRNVAKLIWQSALSK
jgi:D-alanine-D-alanine ligase-like ATP-grasp enzyme